MTYEEFISTISFKYIKPDMLFPGELTVNEEIANISFPVNDDEIKKSFTPLFHVPKMSTFAVSAIINKGVRLMGKDQAFVNVGVWCGFTFLSGLLNNPDKTCIGIDNFSQFEGPEEFFLTGFNNLKSENHYFYGMDYRDYFSKIHQQPIGFYIYDGDHTYRDQYDGLKLAEPFFADGCYILVDDTNTPEAYEGTMDFISDSSNKYRLILDRKTAANGHPTFWNGILILQKQ